MTLREDLIALLEKHDTEIPLNTSNAVLADHMLRAMESLAQSISQHDDEAQHTGNGR